MKYRVINSTETGRTRLTIGQSNGPISDIYVQYINTCLSYNKLPEFTALPSSITIPDSGVLSSNSSPRITTVSSSSNYHNMARIFSSA